MAGKPEDTTAEAPRVLYHYTTESGLLGIVQSGSLWASDAEFLNDAQELQFGRNALHDSLSSAADAIDRSAEPWKQHEYRAMVIESAIWFLDRESQVKAGNEVAAAFVTCFCEEGDLLSQWRGYGSPGGVAIGFHGSAMAGFEARDPNPAPDVHEGSLPLKFIEPGGPVKVSYGQPAIDRMLAEVVPLVGLDLENGPAAPAGVGLTETLLLPALASIKHEAFKEEKEWRLIAMGRATLGEFRTGRSGLVPYVSLGFPASAMAEIVVGPGPNPEVRKAGVERLLIRHGLREVPVRSSDASYRG